MDCATLGPLIPVARAVIDARGVSAARQPPGGPPETAGLVQTRGRLLLRRCAPAGNRARLRATSPGMTEGRRVTHADVPANIYPLGVAYLSDPPLWSSVGKIIDGIPGDWHRSRPSSPQAPLRHGHPWTRDPAGHSLAETRSPQKREGSGTSGVFVPVDGSGRSTLGSVRGSVGAPPRVPRRARPWSVDCCRQSVHDARSAGPTQLKRGAGTRVLSRCGWQ
jgi:hypothetical protein